MFAEAHQTHDPAISQRNLSKREIFYGYINNGQREFNTEIQPLIHIQLTNQTKKERSNTIPSKEN